MINRLDVLFQNKKEKVLNIYFTAGYPKLNDTFSILSALQNAGADIVEIGIPFSDPVADGETIQKANTAALNNGMNVALLFEQLRHIRESIHIPIILMGDINPIIQFGVEKFCQQCEQVGIDGLILPNLPMDEYLLDFKDIFQRHGLYNIFLITPQTSNERILRIDQNSNGFIYMVSSSSTTGSTSGITPEMLSYFKKVNDLNLKNPRLIGFGIKDAATFNSASEFANGAIVGSAFIRILENSQHLEQDITAFVKEVLS